MIQVGTKVKIPAQTLYRVPPDGKYCFTAVDVEGVIKELPIGSSTALIECPYFWVDGVKIWRMRVAVEHLIKLEEPSLADESTPAGKKIWDDVRKAAARTPDYVKDIAERVIQKYQKCLQFKPGQSVRVVQGDDYGRIVTIVGRDGDMLEVRRSNGYTFKAIAEYFEPLSADKPIELAWRVIAIRAHDSDDTKAEITIAGTEGEAVDGAVYLTVTREEAKAIHLGDVYVVGIRRKGD